MKRTLNTREKTLLLILVILVLALGYFKLIFEPIQEQVADYQSLTAQEQAVLDEGLIRVAQMHAMEETVEEIKASGEGKAIPAYDNSGKLMRELYRILADTKEYSLDFSKPVTQDDYIMLRPVSLSFQTATYAQARAIIDALCDSENVNQISDLTIYEGQARDKNSVQTDLVITFFEVAP